MDSQDQLEACRAYFSSLIANYEINSKSAQVRDLEANNMLDSAMSRASVNNSITKPWEDTDALNSDGSSMARKINTNQTCCCGDRPELNCTTFRW